MDRRGNNVIFLSEWKERKESREANCQWKNYYEVLSFHDLQAEFAELVKDLSDKKLDAELTKRSKTLLKEFDQRLAETSHELAESLRELTSDIESRIFELKEEL